MDVPEFVFELHACRWAELCWPPEAERTGKVIVGRQLGTRRRRWDTVILECNPGALDERANFGETALDSDLLHVVREAPREWAWYRDALPHPGYPWRYVREAIHRAADRGVIDTRKRGGRIELRRRFPYPEWVDRVIAIEHKPDLQASAATALATQLEFDIAMGVADEVWLATAAEETDVPPALLEAMPVEVGIVTLDCETLDGSVLWHPRRLDVERPGTRILERPSGGQADRSAARFEYVDPSDKADIRRNIAERAYERGWRGAVEHMRHDCRHFALTADSLTHEPRCRAFGRAQSTAECSGSCASFTPEPPHWRTNGWPIEGGPGRRQRELLEAQRSRHR